MDNAKYIRTSDYIYRWYYFIFSTMKSIIADTLARTRRSIAINKTTIGNFA